MVPQTGADDANILSKMMDFLIGHRESDAYTTQTQEAISTSTPVVCVTSDGEYPPNTEIFETKDMESYWCFGAYCNEYGIIVSWQKSDCWSSSDNLTASVPATPNTTSLSTSTTHKMDITTPTKKSTTNKADVKTATYKVDVTSSAETTTLQRPKNLD